jgi:hypothetical protein
MPMLLIIATFNIYSSVITVRALRPASLIAVEKMAKIFDFIG